MNKLKQFDRLYLNYSPLIHFLKSREPYPEARTSSQCKSSREYLGSECTTEPLPLGLVKFKLRTHDLFKMFYRLFVLTKTKDEQT
jgi:hypothetical protein